jgi:hypothetical protein
MALERPIFIDSYQTGEDLSADASLYKFVKLSAGKVVACTAVTDKPIGVLQAVMGTAGANQTASVCVLGQCLVRTGAAVAIAADDDLATDASGKAQPCVAGTDTTKRNVGRALEAGAAVDVIISAYINCMNPGRAA